MALGGRPRPTAILALCDLLARGALDAARWMGLAVPRDVSVAGIDDLEGSDADRLTSVFVPYRPHGGARGRILAALVEGGEPVMPAPLPTAVAIRAQRRRRAS